MQSVFAKATPRFLGEKYIEGQEETLADFVPHLEKKPAKPVDAATALTLTCRRKQQVDSKGVP